MAAVQGGHRVRHSLEKTDTQSVSERQRNSAEGRGLAYLGVFGWGAGLLQKGMVQDLGQCQSLRWMLGGGERRQLTRLSHDNIVLLSYLLQQTRDEVLSLWR